MSTHSTAVRMIDVKQAVKAAAQFAEDVLGPENVQGARLEEVETSEDGDHWLITLGFLSPDSREGHRTAFEALAGVPARRDYKVFRVDRETGRVVSMKIRSVSSE